MTDIGVFFLLSECNQTELKSTCELNSFIAEAQCQNACHSHIFSFEIEWLISEAQHKGPHNTAILLALQYNTKH